MRRIPRANWGADPLIELTVEERAVLVGARMARPHGRYYGKRAQGQGRCTIKEAARYIGVPWRTLIGWERGERRPRLPNYLKWCAGLGVDPSTLTLTER